MTEPTKPNENEEQRSAPEQTPPMQPIVDMGAVTTRTARGTVYCLTVVGQIEGHSLLPNTVKTTKYEHVLPLLAALVGALFIGVGVGLGVRMGGASGGDDALAMSLSHVTHIKIQWIYLLSDFAVLVLSLSYIPLNRMVYSILTVLLSGQIIGFVQTAGTHPVENMKT